MRFRLFVASLLCAAFVVPALAMAEEGEAKKDRPNWPSPEEFFKKLDKNADGALTLDELPAEAKERGERMFKMKDADEDGKVTLEEFTKRMHRRAPEGKWGGRGPGKGWPGMGPGMGWPGMGPGMGWPGMGPGMGWPGMGPCMGPCMGPGMGPGMGWPGMGPGMGPCMKPAIKTPDFGKVFDKIDKDGDGSLSKEEFVEEAKKFHGGMMKMHAFMARGPRGPYGRMGPRGPYGPRGPEARRDMTGPRAKAGCCDRMGPPSGPRGPHMQKGDRDGRKRPSPEEMKKHFAEFLKKIDTDKDGKISKEEAPERMAKFFDKMDADGDGLVTPEEMKAAREARMKERAEKAGPDKK